MNCPSPIRRSSRIVAISCVLIVLLMSTVIPTTASLVAQPVETQFSLETSATSSATASSNDTHTLSITANSPGRYAVIASGSVNLTAKTREANDSVRQREIQGSLGTKKANGTDRRDTVTFTGHLIGFQATQNVSVTLDGQSVVPAALNGSYIRFTNVRESKKGSYEFTVNGTISPTGSLESGDSITKRGSSATGTLAKRGETDAFYYSGGIQSSEFTGSGRVFINGQEVPINQNNSSTTPTVTSTPIDIGDTPFTMSDLQLSNSEVVVGEPVVISVRVQNDRSKRVTAPVRLGAEGTVVGTREIALFAGDWQTVKFTHTFDSPGNYTVKVGTLERTVRVRESGQSGGIGGFTISQIAIALVGSVIVALSGVRLLRWMS